MSTKYDSRVRGLQLRTFANKQAWYLYYRTKDGRQRKPKIGNYPELSVEAARRAAKDILETVARGGDPKAEWDEARAGITIAQFCDVFMERHGHQKKSADEYRRIIDRYIKPRIGNLRIAEIRMEHVERMHDAISRNAPTQANRVLAVLSSMMSLAERWDYRPKNSNPCVGARRNPERKRRRYVTPQEAKQIAVALRERADRNPDVVAVIWLLLLTGARRSELAGRVLKLNGNVIHLADSKTGEKALYVPDAAVRLIKERGLEGKQLPNGPWVTHYFAKMCRELGIENLHLHDLRHSFASMALTSGGQLDQIGELLGHSSPSTTKRYAHLHSDAAVAMANATADKIMGMMG